MKAKKQRNYRFDTLSFLAPPEAISVSAWADKHRYLSSKSSAYGGRWRTDRAIYQKEPMDAFSDYATRRIVLMWASQLGKGDVVVNCILWMISLAPGPALLLRQTDGKAQDFIRRRVSPAIDDCQELRGKTSDRKARDGDRSLEYIGFPGGSLDARGTQTSGNVKDMPIRWLLGDETDDWPISVGSGKDNEQGDPVELGMIRTSNFPNSKVIFTSTPTTESTSRIWKQFQDSTQEHFYIPCLGCGYPQILSFDRLDDATAKLACESCKESFSQSVWEGQQKAGFWKAHAEHADARGFHLNALYSPFLTWEKLITEKRKAEDLASKGDEGALKAFTNSRLCELWYDKGGNRVKGDELWEKRIVYDHPIPDPVLLLTAGVDCQGGDRQTRAGAKLKYSIYGWGPDRTGYLIESATIWRHLEEPEAWAAVDELLYERTFAKADGTKLDIARIFIDSGFLGDFVYDYARGKQPRVFPIKGAAGNGQPIIKPGKTDKHKAPLFIVGVDTVKDALQSKIRLDPERPGSINFPKLEDGSPVAGADESFFKEICAEYRISKLRNGYHHFSWAKVPSLDNDFLDALVYSFAALEAAGGKARLLALAKGNDGKKVYQPKMGMIQTNSLPFHPDARPTTSMVQPASPKPASPSTKGPLDPSIQTFRRVGRFRMPGQYE